MRKREEGKKKEAVFLFGRKKKKRKDETPAPLNPKSTGEKRGRNRWVEEEKRGEIFRSSPFS